MNQTKVKISKNHFDHGSSQLKDTEITQEVLKVLACSKDYYRVLNLEKEKYTDNELKKSYRKLALKFHPDKNTSPYADEAFRLVSRAFIVLSDPLKKIVYDVNGQDSAYSPAFNSDIFIGRDIPTLNSKKSTRWSTMAFKLSPVILLFCILKFILK